MSEDPMRREEPAVSTGFERELPEFPETVDEAAIERMRVVARVLDEGVRVPGTDFWVGLDPILGILPGAGDTLAAGASLYIVYEAARQGVPASTVVRMLANVAVDFFGGSVPLAGVLFDAVWKANKRNVELAVDRLATDADGGDETEPITVDID